MINDFLAVDLLFVLKLFLLKKLATTTIEYFSNSSAIYLVRLFFFSFSFIILLGIYPLL